MIHTLPPYFVGKPHDVVQEDKLTVLDQFAIAAMQSIMLMDTTQRLIEYGTTDIAAASYMAAQVMMAERKKQ